MSDIRVIVDEQTLQIINAPTIASQGINEDRVLFEFDASWDEYGKIALFYHESDPSTIYQAAVDNTGVAVIPWEVTHEDGRIYFGVAGTNGDTVYTSELLSYRIVKGLYTVGSESIIPTPDVYAQILALLGQLNYNVNSYQSDVTTSVNTISARLDTFVASNAGIYGETVIYDASVTGTYLFGEDQDVAPLNDVSIHQSNFDFIDVFYIFDGVGYVFTKDYRNYNTEHIQVHALSTNAVTTNISFAQIELALSGKHIRVRKATRTDFVSGSGPTITNVDDSYVAQNPADYPAGYIKKIIGRKLTENIELIDARTGVDSTTYATVGAAVRAQIGALEDQIEDGGVTCTDINLDGNIVISAGL